MLNHKHSYLMLNTPVALIIFRRADLTWLALQAIARVKPRKLFVIADGPRPSRPDDIAACAATRAIIDRIDWDCEVHKNYSDVNLGCGQRPATGITWVFEQVEQAIILEDDCVPNPSFFRFCEEMLERYRDDERVMNVGGCNYQKETLPTSYSYMFSRLPGCVGSWATWRRAWRFFDQSLAQWPMLKDGPFLKQILEHEVLEKFYESVFDTVFAAEGNVDYWDYQWAFTCWANRGLAIVPRLNLASNIGWGSEATHSPNPDHPSLNLPALEMPFPLYHPPMVLDDMVMDRQWLLTDSLRFQKKRMRFHRRLGRKLMRMIKSAGRLLIFNRLACPASSSKSCPLEDNPANGPDAVLLPPVSLVAADPVGRSDSSEH